MQPLSIRCGKALLTLLETLDLFTAKSVLTMMTYRIDRFFILLTLGVILLSSTNAQESLLDGGGDRDPEAVKQDEVTHGLIGSFMDQINPLTRMLLEYVNDFLKRYKGLQLPCTLYDPLKWDWECTSYNKP